jgi:CRISPR-associated protein Cmr4
MTTQIKPFFIKAITPLHVGSGSDLGIVDMPIQRESHTSFPKIEASSLKGAIRQSFEDCAKRKNSENDKIKEMQKIQVVFGFDLYEKEYKKNGKEEEYKKIVKVFKDKKTDELKKDFSGALGFTDARILFFPVKSVKGVFAYITCPMVLERFQNDIKIYNENFDFLEKIKIPHIKDNICVVFSSTNTIKKDKDFYVILEEYSFKSIKKINLDEKDFFIPNSKNILDRLIIISDDDFTHFVKNSTEVITRTKIDNITGTVQDGALFTEEYLPAETVMYSLAIANNPFNKSVDDLKEANDIIDFFQKISRVIQIGGNSTLGKGIVEISCEGCKDECK